MLCTTCGNVANITASHVSANASGVKTDKAYYQAKHGKHACGSDWKPGEENFMCKSHDCWF
jgi:hypothetical protein